MDPGAQSQAFIEKADHCFRLARQLRAGAPAAEIAKEIDALGHEFLAHAVAVDTERDRAQRRGRG
jgi:hypothetical protein